jgi:hypothetical protein
MGDYFDMYSDETGAHLAWAATFNDEQDVYYSVITPSYVGLTDNKGMKDISVLRNYPNPFRDHTTIIYHLNERGIVNLKIFTMTGGEVITLVNEIQDAGRHQVEFNASGLHAGVYYYQIKTEKETGSNRFIILK